MLEKKLWEDGLENPSPELRPEAHAFILAVGGRPFSSLATLKTQKAKIKLLELRWKPYRTHEPFSSTFSHLLNLKKSYCFVSGTTTGKPVNETSKSLRASAPPHRQSCKRKLTTK